MDTNKTKPNEQEQQININPVRWKSPEFRNKMVKKCMEVVKKSGCPLPNLSELAQFLERFEAKVHAAAKDEAQYLHWLFEKAKAISSQLKTTESRPRLSNSIGSRETSSAQEAGKSANIDWREQIFQKVQRMKSIYFADAFSMHQQIIRKLQQLESSPQESTIDLRKRVRCYKQLYECILAVLGVSKCRITSDFNETLRYIEQVLPVNMSPKNFSSHHQGQQHSADVQSRQQFGPSHCSISLMKILEEKPSPQALGTQNYPMTEDVSLQNKMCLQDPKMKKQYSNSQQDVNQLPIIKGAGNSLQQQTQGAKKPTEEFSASVNSQGISASPLIENCNKLKEISLKPTLTSDEPSAAMQRFLKVVDLKLPLTSMSSETLSASVGQIRELVYLNDVIPTSESINELPKMVQQQKQPLLIPQNRTNLAPAIEPCSQDRYVTCNDFVPTGRKMSCSINAMTAFDSYRLTDAEKPHLTSVTSKIKHLRIVEKCSLLEEIKEINNLLIDSEIVIGEKDSIQSAAEGAAEDSEGLVIKFLFNAVTVNQKLIFHLSADKKSIIKQLRLLVPTSYPLSQPVILDKLPLEVRDDLKDLSTVAKLKLRFSLQGLKQPWSLRDMAMLWEHCAREAILEYVQTIGGGTFSSNYGGWEMC